MDVREALATARALMDRHGLAGWEVGLDSAKRRAGCCHHREKLISLSRPLTALHGVDEVRDTVAHEVAHALVGPGHSHDAVWQAKALELGSTGRRCLPEDAPAVEGHVVGTCPNGHISNRHRRPETVSSCDRCAPGFDPRFLLSWTWHGVSVRMHPKYVAGLVRLADTHGGPAVEQLELDGLLGGGRHHPVVQGFLAPVIAAGTRVRLTGAGRYAGAVGTVLSRQRTAYRVRIADGVLAVPPGLMALDQG